MFGAAESEHLKLVFVVVQVDRGSLAVDLLKVLLILPDAPLEPGVVGEA